MKTKNRRSKYTFSRNNFEKSFCTITTNNNGNNYNNFNNNDNDNDTKNK